MSKKIFKYSQHIQDLLGQLSDEEVISLATTTTGGLLKTKINNRQDAVKAVIGYSEDLSSILKRKIFTREKMLAYLYERNVAVKLPITKPDIIKKILRFWKKNFDDDNEVDGNNIDNESIYSDDIEDSPVSSHTLTSSHSALIGNKPHIQDSSAHQLTSVSSDLDDQSTVDLLAEQFSQWFYKLLNENQLMADHFYPDATLNIALISNGESNTNNILGDPQAISNCLLTTKLQYDLFFNPNLTRNGLKSQMDPHGLVIVTVCGTLHSKNVCVGVFEQMFALARDPFADNNWKIKRTDLTLKSSNSSSCSIPQICSESIYGASDIASIGE